MTDAPQSRSSRRWLRVIGNLAACLAILAASAGAIVWINRTEPTAQQIKATRQSSALVETVTVRRGTYSPRLVVLGTVQAAQDITLSPRVSGQVIEMSPKLVPGGMVSKGDVLLRIDPADFENALSISESELEQAEASLKIEQGRQSLAKKELALLEGAIDETNRALVLRQPQITSIRAEVSAAKAAVERAKLDLARTTVVAPFDAQILSRSVNVGSQVSPGDDLAQLVGIDEYWISAAIPVRNLQWLQFGESEDQPGSTVRLRNPDSWPPGAVREGRVARMIGALDQQTRLARVLVTVPDPLGRTSDAPPLILDTLIQTEIEARPLRDVARIDRDLVRDSDTVWVMKDDKLEIRQADIVFRDAQHAYIRDGLQDGDEVVITTLATVTEGVGLRKVDPSSDKDSADSGETLPSNTPAVPAGMEIDDVEQADTGDADVADAGEENSVSAQSDAAQSDGDEPSEADASSESLRNADDAAELEPTE
ncbi:efflux RND transporter periplasmic adaptor subunit [Roseiconus nitratireducens]|uniref:Efflux RND transporter periplasmic adaptor subunit n=1 Tax=Roseiconus nitratireducens TaxID=2605748 RepID=A0A5M6CWV0_9BACT|nr:efflux RND transporter periplasmic adaptor subunit [Roseiconus nitratireducens]KAA5539573.1 efflux RND transporter periplasmic adaptor subunit [Roseiconus nitratireducens]